MLSEQRPGRLVGGVAALIGLLTGITVVLYSNLGYRASATVTLLFGLAIASIGVIHLFGGFDVVKSSRGAGAPACPRPG
jgi:hypothetical protein